MFFDFVNGAKFKRCKNCKFWVERSEVFNEILKYYQGCNRLVCKCGYNFCYACGEKFDDSKHYNCGQPPIRTEVHVNPINRNNKKKGIAKNKKNMKIKKR